MGKALQAALAKQPQGVVDLRQKGPAHAYLNALHKVGWTSGGPLKIVDHAGEDLDLLAGSAAMIKSKFRQRWQHLAEVESSFDYCSKIKATRVGSQNRDIHEPLHGRSRLGGGFKDFQVKKDQP